MRDSKFFEGLNLFGGNTFNASIFESQEDLGKF